MMTHFGTAKIFLNSLISPSLDPAHAFHFDLADALDFDFD